jgi:hypothetical protein
MVVLALVYLAFSIILILKFIEAFLRVIAGVGFDRSRHVSDSGLLGVLFLIGCCSSRRPRSSSSKRARKQRQVSHHPGSSAGGSSGVRPRSESSIGLYKPPNGQFTHTHHHSGSHLPLPGSAAGSTHSGQPASVLRPEHALRPYHEDSDDESGHIMSSWQFFPTGGNGAGGRQGAYSPVDATPPKAEPTTSSGFSRVGGGRAHIDSPYAITHGPGVGVTGPSASSMVSQDASVSAGGAIGGAASTIGTRTRADSSTTRSRYDSLTTRNFAHATSGSGSGGYDDFQPTASRTTVAQYPMSTLPAGAMAPAHHVRTKSQTAIVEHALPVFRASGPPARLASTSAEEATVVQQQQKRRFSVFDDDDDDDDDDGDGDDNADSGGRDSHPRKKHWFQLRKTRRHSDGDAVAQQPQDLGPAPPPTEEEGGGGDGTAGTSRSFVVLREKRPGTSQPSMGPSSYRPPRSPAA